MDIVESVYMGFEEYKNIVDKYSKTDNREINFQNRVVMRLLDRITKNSDDICIVDVHSQFKNRESDIHERKYYAGNHTPDLLIVKDWNYANKNKKRTDYLAIVEVKSPILDPISSDSVHTSEEMEEYLDICNHVILTDCYTWKFYESKIEVKSIVLHDKSDWIIKKEENDSFIQQEFGFEQYKMKCQEWDELCEYLHSYLNV